jgi:hypothetical protein
VTSLTAIHEAGHAWAYWRVGLPLRYITLRPADPQTVGLCRPWRPRRIPGATMALVASAGPIAEAMEQEMRGADDPWFDWNDHLLGAVLAGGHDDLPKAGGLLDRPESTANIKALLRADWESVTALATALDARKTVRGRDAFDLLADSSRTARTAQR